MTPQFVDLNADGYNDMVMGIFDGCVHIVEGSKDGFQPKKNILDKNGDFVRISMYWDFDEETYLYVDRSTEGEEYHKEHHLTSATTVDWDRDGDLDLLLGAYEGALYLCMNEGTKEEPKFSDKNLYVRAEGEHITFKSGLATPHICDWNGDGNFDILCGGSKEGGVFYYENKGFDKETGTPSFKKAVALIEPGVDKESRTIPVFPGSGFHIETVDYDSDGDLDLLVGGITNVTPPSKDLTVDEEKELADLDKSQKEIQAKMNKFMEGVKNNEDYNKIKDDEEFIKIRTANAENFQRIRELRPFPERRNLVWLFRNKGTKVESTFTSSKN